eukprot:SAG22_NODE_4267_length_1323_cov_1.581699_3_plen_175_part_01
MCLPPNWRLSRPGILLSRGNKQTTAGVKRSDTYKQKVAALEKDSDRPYAKFMAKELNRSNKHLLEGSSHTAEAKVLKQKRRVRRMSVGSAPLSMQRMVVEVPPSGGGELSSVDSPTKPTETGAKAAGPSVSFEGDRAAAAAAASAAHATATAGSASEPAGPPPTREHGIGGVAPL